MREPRKTKVDLCLVLDRTEVNRQSLEVYARAIADEDREARREASQCRVCWYGRGRIGGAMVTAALCGLCDREMSFGNTCVDVLCKECARKHRLCVRCGGDVETRNRRKL